MPMADKAVSTEDLCVADQKESAVLGVARLEAILHTLVENKVEALKNDNRKASSVHSSPKTILNRLRLTSTSSQSSKGNEGETQMDPKRSEPKVRHHIVDVRPLRRPAFKQEALIALPENQKYRCRVEGSSNSDDERYRSMHYDNIYIDNSCPSLVDKPPTCSCNMDVTGQLMHFDDDYISLKIDGYDDAETDAFMSEEAQRRARRKRRRRRKRRMKKRLAIHHSHLVDPIAVHDSYKNLTEDELSRRAKWTIVATACLLLFMCVLLIGITLRMAPIIDEMVRTNLSNKMCHNLDRKSDTSIFLQIPDKENDRFSSRSSSFSYNYEDTKKLRKAVSLEDVLYGKGRRKDFEKCNKRRRSTQLTSRKNSRRRTAVGRSNSSKRSSKYFSGNESNFSKYEYEYIRRSSRISCSVHDNSRKNSCRSARKPSSASCCQEKLLTEEDLLKHKRRRKIIFAIVGIFCFLVLVSILSVLVTLTHRSTAVISRNNSTVNLTYYTFSPDPKILCRQGKDSLCPQTE